MSNQTPPLTAPTARNVMAAIVSLCKRTGYIYPSSDLYGGLNGFYDYGPLGIQLKENIRRAWWESMVDRPPLGPDGTPLQIFGLDSSIILNPEVWRASGHVGGFNDLLVDDTQTKKRYRADHVLCYKACYEGENGVDCIGYVSVVSGDDAPEQLEKRLRFLERKRGGRKLLRPSFDAAVPYVDLDRDAQRQVLAPDADEIGTLTEPRAFGLMFETSVGALASAESKAYLRPETAQGIFINYKNVLDTTRAKIPFGIAQIGKAFRNEITPRNFIFRSREFEQMELEWFCAPEESEQWLEFWLSERRAWWKKLGVKIENLCMRPHTADELAHYSSACTDIEYRFPFSQGGFGELEGIAHRADFDLKQHALFSKTKLDYHDPTTGKSFVPHVIEPSAGLTRALLAVLCDSYRYDESRPSAEFLALPPRLAPITVGVFPLMNKGGLPEYAVALEKHLGRFFKTKFEEKQSIGKRYARMDEIGTPFCVTVDQQTLVDDTVTVRDRDSGLQQRIESSRVDRFIDEKLQPDRPEMGSFVGVKMHENS